MVGHSCDPARTVALDGRQKETGGYAWYSWVRLLTFHLLEDAFIGLLSAIGLMGGMVCLADRQWLLPACLVLIMVLDPRSGSTYATVPLAVLVGIGLDRVVLFALAKTERIATQVAHGPKPRNLRNSTSHR